MLAIGNAHEQQDDDSQALYYLKKSLEIKEELSDKYGICQLNLEMGKVYIKTKEYNKALSCALKGLEIGNEGKQIKRIKRVE